MSVYKSVKLLFIVFLFLPINSQSQVIDFFSFGNGYDYELETAHKAFICIYKGCFEQLRSTRFITENTYFDENISEHLESFYLSNDSVMIAMKKNTGLYSSSEIERLKFYGVFCNNEKGDLLFQILLTLNYENGGLLVADSIELVSSQTVLEIEDFKYLYDYNNSNGSKTNIPTPPLPPPPATVVPIRSMNFDPYQYNRVNLCNSCQERLISKSSSESYWLRERYNYEYINQIHTSQFLVKDNGKYGIVNYFNKTLIPIIYDEITIITNLYSRVKKDGLYGIYNIKGEEILPVRYDTIEIRTVKKSGSFVQVYIAEINGKYGVVDQSGAEILPFVYDSIELFYSKFFKVKSNGLFGLYSIYGKSILDASYAEVDFESPFASENWCNLITKDGVKEIVRIIQNEEEFSLKKFKEIE